MAEIDAEVIEASDGSEDTLVALAPGADAIMTCFAEVTPAVIRAAGASLRVVARYGVGVDNIAVEEATSLGIPVTNVPAYCVDEVAEHVLAMIFALERNLLSYNRGVRDGDWRLRTEFGTRRISGRTIGVIGGGRIGSALRARCEALGMHVLVHHLQRSSTSDLHSFLGRCDYVSLHVPLTAETRGMVNDKFFAAMRPDGFFINTARGGVVDHGALERALYEKRIAGAGVDVFDPEILPADHPLLAQPNLLATPHTAFYSVESIESLAEQAARSVVDVLSGRPPQSVVNG
ncbi:C-terminal binding protein [Cryobacterium sp. AP23]